MIAKAAERFFAGRKVKTEDAHWVILNENYKYGLEARKPFEQRWVLNLAFLMGKQYSFFNKSSQLLQQLRRVKGKRRHIDNQLISRWRRQVADLIRTKPSVSVVPATNDEEDIKAAKVGNKVLENFYRTNDMRKKLRELGSWIYATGNGYLDDRWDTKAGPVDYNKKGELVYAGDASCDVWSPFEIVLPVENMGQTNIHKLPWMDKVKWRDLDWFINNFPKRGKEVKEEQRSVSLTEITSFSRGLESTNKRPGAFMHNMYIQPCAQFPKGKFLQGANGIILGQQDYPFNHYHLEHFKDIDVPGVFFGMATLEAAIPLQNRWNATTNDIDEFNRSCAKGKLLVPRGAKLETLPDNSHGEILQYKPVLGHKPDLLTLKGLPATYQLALTIIRDSLQDLFSQHEITRGTNKSDIRSGEMVSLLREQDAFGAVPSHAVFEEGYEAAMGRVLRRIKTGYKAERVIQVVGKEGEFDVFSFKGADLRNNSDVMVKRESSLPDSRIAREAMILRKFELGLYGNPDDPEVRRHVMNMLDDAVVKDIYSDTRLDEALARWENELLNGGEIDSIIVNSYDNHMLHNREHQHFQKSRDYQKLKFKEPEKFRENELRFLEHTLSHSKFIEQEIARQIAMEGEVKSGGKN